MFSYLFGWLLSNLIMALVISAIIYSILRFKPYAFYFSVMAFELFFCGRFIFSFGLKYPNVIYLSLIAGVALIVIYKIVKSKIIEVKINFPDRYNIKYVCVFFAVTTVVFASTSFYILHQYISLEQDYNTIKTEYDNYDPVGKGRH